MLSTEQMSPKQKRVMLAPYDDRMLILAPGPVRCGKTASLIPSFLSWSLDFIDKEFLVAGRTMTQVNGMLFPLMIRWAEHYGLQVRRKVNEKFVQVGYNRFYLYEAATEACREKIQGFTFQGAYLDEIAIMPRGFFDEATARCSESGARVMASCNPEGPYHWVKTQIIDKADENGYTIIPFQMSDNPSLSDAYLKHLKSLLSGVSLRRRVYGEWAAASGLVYPEYTAEAPPSSEPLSYDLAIDYAPANHSHALLFADYGTDAIYVVDEWRSHDETLTDRQQALDLNQWLGKREVRHVIIDPRAASFRVELAQMWKREVHKADSDVQIGIQVTAALLARGLIRIAPHLDYLRTELGAYQWDEDAAKRGEDKPKKIEDHAVDALRYFAMAWGYRVTHDDIPTH